MSTRADAGRILFLGAGKANVVVDLPLADIPHAPAALRLSAATQRAALRIRSAVHKECAECYAALEPYAGSRHVVALDPTLYHAVEAVVPAKHRKLITGATEATIVPNFTSDPAQLLRMDITAGEEPGRVADYTVEVKPKGAWQQPQVVGVVVDGATHWIAEAKHRHCRYAQMLRYKEVRDEREGESAHTAATAPLSDAAAADASPPPPVNESTQPAALPYCPNFLFRPALSSREGLRRLLRSPQNNLKVISYHESRAELHAGDPKTLTVAELDAVADAVDESGVLAPLAHLQLCGCAPPAPGDAPDVVAARSVPVLDVELLYHWSRAADPSAVEWLVLPSDPAAQCTCTAAEASSKALSVAEAQRVRPVLDLATCLERFYVSTTAKDVSLMVAVSARRGEPDVSTPCTRLSGEPAEVGGVFVQRGLDVYRVGAVDLDDKKHKSIDHYHAHDRDIVAAFVKSGQQ